MTLYVPPTATSLGLGSGDSPTFAGLTLSGNLTWNSGTSPSISGILDHNNTSSTKTYTFPDASGNVALMGFANTGSLSASTTIHAGGIIDTDATVKIKNGASHYGILSCSNSSSDKTYTFPNTTGTVALTSQIPASFGISLDGGASAITTGIKGIIAYFPYSMTITGWYIAGTPSGSLVLDVWRLALGGGFPSVANTITGSEKPTLSTQQQNSDTSLTTWGAGLTITAGDCIVFNVDSCTDTTKANIVIIGTRAV